MAELVQRGWAAADARGFKLTRAGLRFADAAAGEFLILEEAAGGPVASRP